MKISRTTRVSAMVSREYVDCVRKMEVLSPGLIFSSTARQRLI